MSFFDRLRPKWKHPDPAVREQAVRALDDQAVLEKIADSDACEAVQLAAVRRLTDQHVLARFARGKEPLALAAMKQLTERSMIISVAQSAESNLIREMAVSRIDDAVVLHRIATSDIDPRVRLKARDKRTGPDEIRDFIRNELSKLQPAPLNRQAPAEFCGTLKDVSTALIRDGRFQINGRVDQNESRPITIRELGAAPTPEAEKTPSAAATTAQFLAFNRGPAGEPKDASSANAFFEITVCRTDHDTFHAWAEEKRLVVVQNAVTWSRVSNGTTSGSVDENKSVAEMNR